MNVFKAANRFLIALTYGPNAEWVKNVLAAGHAQLESRGVRYQLTEPSVIQDATRQRFPPLVRTVLWIVGTDHFMQLSIDA